MTRTMTSWGPILGSGGEYSSPVEAQGDHMCPRVPILTLHRPHSGRSKRSLGLYSRQGGSVASSGPGLCRLQLDTRTSVTSGPSRRNSIGPNPPRWEKSAPRKLSEGPSDGRRQLD